MEKYPLCQCEVCPLRSQPFVHPEGPEDAHVLVIGQAPGREEVRLKRPFVGLPGLLLEQGLKLSGKKREDVRIDNTVLCFVPPGTKPEIGALYACFPHIEDAIKRAKVIVPMGNEALQALQRVLEPQTAEGVPF